MTKARYIILIVLLICCFWSFSQDRSTWNKQNQVQLIRIEPSTCNSEYLYFRIRDRIISKHLENDSLYLHLGLVLNCCIKFIPEITFDSNALYITIDRRTGEISECMCRCCFELKMVFTGLKDTSFSTFISERPGYERDEIFLSAEMLRTYPEKYEIVAGDTINRVNKYGYKVGIWQTFYDSSNAVRSRRFYDEADEIRGDDYNTNLKDVVWMEGFYEDGSLRGRGNRDSVILYQQNGLLKRKYFFFQDGDIEEWYHENGMLKSRCKKRKNDENDEKVEDVCEYWDEQGNSILKE